MNKARKIRRGDQMFNDVIQSTPVRGLDLMPAGASDASTAGPLPQRLFRELSRDSGMRYERVIVDCPAVWSEQTPADL
jgi:Mrp family chromosome partitioning ATPase